MRYLKRSAIVLSLLLVLFGATAVTAEAQRRGYRRPVIIVNQNPFWHGWGYNPYYYDPYYRERQQRDYLENRVDGNLNELEKHKQKYYADGVLTDKERRELADDEKDYNNSVRQLDRYHRRY
ncbi:MAG TPA: hypothetical protein VGO50_19920 [Pyrinomonadaceae bacterium]|jgi:hypothetical protein|nr:hypothetical protein [Pyrinomonadaceae bacterium]